MSAEVQKIMPFYPQLEGIIQTLDRLWLDHTNSNFLLCDIIDADIIDHMMIVKLIANVNDKLPDGAKIDLDEIIKSIQNGDKMIKVELTQRITRIIENSLIGYVRSRGIYQSNTVLACMYKYFLEKADDNREFFRQRTIPISYAADILSKSHKLASALNGVSIPVDEVSKHLSGLDKEIPINDEAIKSVKAQTLYENFISRIQK